MFHEPRGLVDSDNVIFELLLPSAVGMVCKGEEVASKWMRSREQVQLRKIRFALGVLEAVGVLGAVVGLEQGLFPVQHRCISAWRIRPARQTLKLR